MGEEEKDLETTVSRLRNDISRYQDAKKRADDRALESEWKAAVKTFCSTHDSSNGASEYPRMSRLFDIVREDGKIRLVLSYDQFNPDPDFANEGQRRQVEALLKFEQPLVQLIEEAGNMWRAGNFEGEATLLEEYAISNPQRDAILDLAAEARRDALSGASAKSRPRRH